MTRTVWLGLALATIVGAAGCGSSGRTTTHRPAPASATSAAANPELQGTIVFRRFLDNAHSHGALFVMNADGTGIHQITRPPADAVDSLNGPPGATAHGATLVFDRSTPSAAGIFRVGLDGRGEREVPAPPGVPGDGWPAVSHDGTRIAVARAWGHQDKFQDLKNGLYVLAIDGGHPRLLADFGYRADVGGATWSPDGKTIVFSAHNNGPGKPAGASALFAVSADGRGLRRLTQWDSEQQISGPAYSPDGKIILFRLKPSGQDFGGDYWTVRSDGSARQQLTHFGSSHTTASATWSPDSSMIVFADTGMGGNDDLYVMRADGGGIRRLTRTPQWESAALWLRP
ncbi:MAG: TolB family protein [Solirubrobacteraceae bacterium]